MIRLALALTLFSILGLNDLPQWRASFTAPFHEGCLKNTPESLHKSVIQSLVCGSSLKNLSEQQSWKNLGLIHVLVVSGGHLSILASLLMHISKIPLLARYIHARVPISLITFILVFFSLGNRLQPPVLRALLEWVGRTELEKRGWRPAEISLVSTWIALPFSASIFDLLSLALSFFASVVVECVAKYLHRRPVLQAIALQSAVWWILLPLLFTMGLPHPLTSLVNIVLAPFLGATLIPLAMVAWSSHFLPAFSGESSDPIFMGVAFDFAWSHVSNIVQNLAQSLPQATTPIAHARALQLGFELTSLLTGALTLATCALLIRSRRKVRRDEMKKSRLGPLCVLTGAILLSIVIHRELMARS